MLGGILFGALYATALIVGVALFGFRFEFSVLGAWLFASVGSVFVAFKIRKITSR